MDTSENITFPKNYLYGRQQKNSGIPYTSPNQDQHSKNIFENPQNSKRSYIPCNLNFAQ